MTDHKEKMMSTFLKEVFKQDICYRFYVEKKSKTKIAEEIGCSRNTVKKYIRECPESSFKAGVTVEEIGPVVHHDLIDLPLKTLQLSINEAIEAGDVNLHQIDVLKMAIDQINDLGITSPIDLHNIEIAFENYIQYRSFSRRVTFLNGHSLDANWLKSSEKMVKIVSKYADTAQKHLKMYQDMIKELEIKYKKRSPDFGRFKNLNIQNNEFNLSQDSIDRPINVQG